MNQHQKDALAGLGIGAFVFFLVGTWILWAHGALCGVFVAGLGCGL